MEYLLKEGPFLGRAHEQYKHFTQDDKNRMAYESRMKYLRDKISTEGEARDEGKLESKIEIARNMKNEGLAPELIVKVTGLTLDEIASL